MMYYNMNSMDIEPLKSILDISSDKKDTLLFFIVLKSGFLIHQSFGSAEAII